MNVSPLLIVILSHGGHFLSGTNATINMHWAAKAIPSQAVVAWEISYGAVSLENGSTKLGGADSTASIKIKVPEVRTITHLRMVYRVTQKEGGGELTHGEATIVAYPSDLAQDSHRLYEGRQLTVFDPSASLSKALSAVKLHPMVVRSATALALTRADILIVGTDSIGASPFEALPLESMAQAGASILVLAQTRCKRIGPDMLIECPAARALHWNRDHPLLAGLDGTMLDDWCGDVPGTMKALVVSPSGSVQEVGYYKGEKTVGAPTQVDALILTRTIGTGRLTSVQLPIDDWVEDPRAIILLNNALAYLAPPTQPANNSPVSTGMQGASQR